MVAEALLKSAGTVSQFAIFNPASWRGADTLTQSVTSCRDITGVQLLTHYTLISPPPRVFYWPCLLKCTLSAPQSTFFTTFFFLSPPRPWVPPHTLMHKLWMFLIWGGCDHIPFLPRLFTCSAGTHTLSAVFSNLLRANSETFRHLKCTYIVRNTHFTC